MNKDTYGKAPAALYLAEHLKDKPKALQRKVGRILSQQTELLYDLIDAHKCNTLTLRSFGRLLMMLSEQNQRCGEYIKRDDELAGNLVANILEGRVKLWKNRAQAAKRQVANVQRNTEDGMTPQILFAEPIAYEKSDVMMLEKSRSKLKRLNKPNTLYE